MELENAVEDESQIQGVSVLPPEALKQIFQFLTLEDKKLARCVSQQWRQVLDDTYQSNYNFNVMLRDKGDDDLLKYFFKSSVEFERVILYERSRDFPGFTTEFPRIRNVTIHRGNTLIPIKIMLEFGCQFAETLSIKSDSLTSVTSNNLAQFLPEIKFNNLTALELNIVMFRNYDGWLVGEKHTNVVGSFLEFAMIHTLKRLSLKVTDGVGLAVIGDEDCTAVNEGLWLKFYGFIGHHVELKSLRLMFCLMPATIQTLTLPADIQENIRQNTKLEEFELVSSGYEVYYLEWLLPCLFEAATLSKLGWNNEMHGNISQQPQLQQQSMIRQHHQTLSELDITFYPSNNLEYLTDCTSLQILKLRDLRTFDDINISIPTVKQFEITMIDANLPANFAVWILNRFPQVQTIKFHRSQMIAVDVNLFSAILRKLTLCRKLQNIYISGLYLNLSSNLGVARIKVGDDFFVRTRLPPHQCAVWVEDRRSVGPGSLTIAEFLERIMQSD